MPDYCAAYEEQYRNTFEYWVTTVRHEVAVRMMLERLPRQILEVGPGPDPIFRRYDGAFERYVVMDPRDNYGVSIGEIITASGRSVETMKNRVEDSDLPDGSFDYVLLSSIIHEVENPEEVLWAARRLCSLGGIVLINVPNVNSLHMLLGVEMGLVGTVFDMTEVAVKFGRPTRFNMERLVGMVEDCGFAVLRKGSYLLKPFSNDIMFKIVTPEMVEGLVRLVERFPENGCELYVEASPCE